MRVSEEGKERRGGEGRGGGGERREEEGKGRGGKKVKRKV